MDETLSLSDLKDALKETLEARGSLGPIKARLRAEIFQALDEGATKPKLSNENLIINELIREYFEYNGYSHALSVFLPESGQPVEKPFQRRFLSHELNVSEDPRYTEIPLLYGIIAGLQDSKKRRVSSTANNADSISISLLQNDNLTSKSLPPHQPSLTLDGSTAAPSPVVFTN